MSLPYVGEIRLFGGNFAINGWAFCNGQLIAISQNTTLFQLIGTTYGGDGVNTFALPDLQGRIPIHQGTLAGGSTYVMGQRSGTESVTLTTNQLPAHSHSVTGNSGNATTADPTNNFLATQPDLLEYTPQASINATMKSNAISLNTGGQPHENRIPLLTVTYVISLFGVFPSQN